MKNDKLVPGMILVLIGAAFLLHNFGYIHFQWNNIWHLWPVFLVIGGVNLLFAHNKSAWATVLKITVIVGGFALILFGNFNYRNHWWPGFRYHYNKDNDDDEINFDDDDDDSDSSDSGKMVKVSGDSQFREPFNAAVKVAQLNIKGGATSYRLNDTTNDLFNASTHEFHGRYQFTSHQEDSVFVMDFIMKNHKGVWGWGNNNNDSNVANIKLNTNPEWEVNIDAGATDLNFDLSKYKVRSVKINGGAGAFKVKVGQPLAETNINVSTGASDVTIEVPNNAACHIKSDSGLSSNTFDGFNKMNNGEYETGGFDSAKNKIYIHISGGISDFKVHRY
jgi:hypothetical protein